jgi:hypothetical protein
MDPEPPNDAAPPASPAPPISSGPTSSSGPTPGVSAPASPHPHADHRPPPLPQLITELRDLVVAYLKQQTLVPLQQLGRYIGFGLAGSLLLGFGVLFLAMSGLRALQEESGDTFTGDWSWVPYIIVIFALMVGGALVWLARGMGRSKKEARTS